MGALALHKVQGPNGSSGACMLKNFMGELQMEKMGASAPVSYTYDIY